MKLTNLETGEVFDAIMIGDKIFKVEDDNTCQAVAITGPPPQREPAVIDLPPIPSLRTDAENAFIKEVFRIIGPGNLLTKRAWLYNKMNWKKIGLRRMSCSGFHTNLAKAGIFKSEGYYKEKGYIQFTEEGYRYAASLR